MSKLADRLPAAADKADKLAMATNVLALAQEDDGRVYRTRLVTEIHNGIAALPVNDQLIVEEGRRMIAEQIASAWENSRVIRIDRDLRMPVYQMTLGFEQSYFKVGTQYVPAEVMGVDDFETMLDRQERRIQNAQTDSAIWREFFETVRPGLERGESLVTQFQAGTLAVGSTAKELEEGEPSEEEE